MCARDKCPVIQQGGLQRHMCRKKCVPTIAYVQVPLRHHFVASLAFPLLFLPCLCMVESATSLAVSQHDA